MKVMTICSLAIIIVFALAKSDWESCSKCLCKHFRKGHKDIMCDKVTITLRSFYLNIECSKGEKEKTDYSLFWDNIKNEQISVIGFKNCSLPDEAVFDWIGAHENNSGIVQIDIEENDINGWSALTKDHMKNLPQLISLTLKGHTNLNLTDDFFEGSPELTAFELNLKQVYLSAHVFRPLRHLELLRIFTKHQLIIPDGLFKHTPHLIWLTLSQEDVTFNNETSFNSIKWPAQLESLIIRRTFPVSGKLIDLNLPYLYYLKINHSNISKIDNNAFIRTVNITKLSLRGNQLATISSFVFRHLHNLKELDLSENRISRFQINKNSLLPALKYLYLSHNLLKESHFLRFMSSTLHILEINNNQLESFYISSMMILDVSYNRLQENSFLRSDEKTRLKIFNISHNSLNKINFMGDIKFAYKVEKLDFSFNNISTISADDMTFLTNFSIFTDLSNNPITTVTTINIKKPKEMNDYYTINIKDVLFDCTCSIYDLLEYLKMDDNMINIIVGKSTCYSPSSMKGRLLKDLKNCDVVCEEKKQCPRSCQCYRRTCDKAILAACSLQTPLVFPPEISKLELTIQNSTFDPHQIDEATFQKVSQLSIANNNILTLTVQHIPDNITVMMSLDLRNNSISHIGEDFVNKLKGSPSLKTVQISGNKIVCDCENQALLYFIQKEISIFNDTQNEKCFNEQELIRLVSITDLCGYKKALTIAGVVVAIVIIIILACIAFYYKYQTEFKVWLFAKGWFVSWITEEEIDKNKVYDAFLAWSHKDDEFVLNSILSKLEEGPNPFKICVHYRDWDVGEMINTQINRSIKQSRRTLVVLTPNFLKSPWGMYEFKQAHCYALEEKRVRVIVICHGDLGPRDKLDPDLQAYLATRTYIEWSDARFWEKLSYALPHPTGRTDSDGTFYYCSGMVHFRRRA